MISIWVVDDHAVIRQGLKRILSEEGPEFRVTGEAGSAAEMFVMLEKQAIPSILILDLSMPGRSGIDALAELKERFSQIKILVLSIHPEDQYALQSLKSGASGYLSKECAPEQLVEALRTIVQGERYITTAVANLLAENLNTEGDKKETVGLLSDRELQILILIAQGKSLTNIGKKFFLSVKTVSTYRARVLKKMKMKTNADLIQYAILKNLITKNENAETKLQR